MFITTATELPRVMNCNGSRLIPAAPQVAEVDQTARDEGNAVHWLIQQLFNGGLWPNNAVGAKAFNGVFINREMVDHACEYLNCVRVQEIETDCGWSVAGQFQINARADHASWDAVNQIDDIDDYKNGWTIVEPENNWTLLSHAIGRAFKRGSWPQAVRLSIYQPKPIHNDGIYRTWEITGDELQDRYHDICDELSNLTDIVSTGNHCYRCPALLNCPARREATFKAVEVSRRGFTDALSDTALSYELKVARRAAARLKDRITAMEELAQHRVKHGAVVEGFAVEHKYGHRKFAPYVTPDLLSVMTGKDMAIKSLPTPAEAVRRGMSKEAMEAITERPNIGIKLVEIDATKRAEKFLNKRA